MRGHGVQAEACLVIPSQVHNVCAISVLNLIQRRVKRSTPVMIWVKTDVKTFACPFVDNVCNSLVAHGRTSSLIPCNTKLYYCSISKPLVVFVLKEFLNTPKSSLFSEPFCCHQMLQLPYVARHLPLPHTVQQTLLRLLQFLDSLEVFYPPSCCVVS